MVFDLSCMDHVGVTVIPCLLKTKCLTVLSNQQVVNVSVRRTSKFCFQQCVTDRSGLSLFDVRQLWGQSFLHCLVPGTLDLVWG